MMTINAILVVGALLSAASSSVLPRDPPVARSSLTWDLKPTNSTQQFRGLSPISRDVVWVSGTNSTVLLTTNGGTSWINVSPSLAENSTLFQFRDVEAFSFK